MLHEAKVSIVPLTVVVRCSNSGKWKRNNNEANRQLAVCGHQTHNLSIMYVMLYHPSYGSSLSPLPPFVDISVLASTICVAMAMNVEH